MQKIFPSLKGFSSFTTTRCSILCHQEFRQELTSTHPWYMVRSSFLCKKTIIRMIPHRMTETFCITSEVWATVQKEKQSIHYTPHQNVSRGAETTHHCSTTLMHMQITTRNLKKSWSKSCLNYSQDNLAYHTRLVKFADRMTKYPSFFSLLDKAIHNDHIFIKFILMKVYYHKQNYIT